MPTFVVLTRLTPEAVKVPGELKRLERAVADHIRKDCPQVPTTTWTSSRLRTRSWRPRSWPSSAPTGMVTPRPGSPSPGSASSSCCPRETLWHCRCVKRRPAAIAAKQDRRWLLRADGPGLDEKAIEVTVQDGSLAIRGERKEEAEEKKEDYRTTLLASRSTSRRRKRPGSVQRRRREDDRQPGTSSPWRDQRCRRQSGSTDE
jgi:hypothetical protein